MRIIELVFDGKFYYIPFDKLVYLKKDLLLDIEELKKASIQGIEILLSDGTIFEGYCRADHLFNLMFFMKCEMVDGKPTDQGCLNIYSDAQMCIKREIKK